MEKIRVAFYTKTFLPISETFTYERVVFSKKFKPVVICDDVGNLGIFPYDAVRSYSSRKKFFQTKRSFFEQAAGETGVRLLTAQHSLGGMTMLPVARKLGLPLITFFHGSDVFAYRDIGFKLRLRRLFRDGSVFIVNCRYMKDELAKMGCRPEKLLVSYSGIDLDKFKTKDRSKKGGEFRVLMCGRLVEVKGHIYGIEAFKLFRSRNPGIKAKLLIVGEGPLEKELKVAAGRVEGIEFLGALPHSELPGLYRGCDAVIVPSIHTKAGNPDAIPIVAREAMACGLPVIGTNIAGMPEVIDDGVNGFLVRERSAEAIADKLEIISGDPTRAQEIGRNARRTVEEKFDLREKIKEMEEIFSGFIH